MLWVTAGNILTRLKLLILNHMGAKPHLEIYFFSFLQKMGTNSKAEFHLTRLADMEETFPIESIIYEGV